MEAPPFPSSASVGAPPQIGGKKKQRRNRKAASCNNCRSKKLRCDRVAPCSSCVAKGEESKCVWDTSSVPPLITARDRNETEHLRHEVDRLQGLIDLLMANSPMSRELLETNGLGGVPPIYSPTTSSQSPGRDGDASSDGHGPTPHYDTTPKDEDLAAHDIAQKLGRLTIKHFTDAQQPGGDIGPEHLITEAQNILDQRDEQAFPSPDHNFVAGGVAPSPAASVFPFSKCQATTTEQILSRLPARPLAEVASQHYFRTIDWYLHPCPRHIFQRHTNAVWDAVNAGAPVEPFSLAICLSIWAVGLAGMPAVKAAQKGFQANKDSLAKEWLDLAAGALAIGRFLEKPNVEAIRALLVMAVHFVALSPGDDGGAGVAYLVLSVQSCLQLHLHRDPDKSPGRFSPAEAEDRRRLFWLTFVADQFSSTTTGRRYNMLHLRDIDTKLPKDVADEKMGEPEPSVPSETDMTSLICRIRIAQLAERISEEAFGIKPISYSTIRDLDQQVNDLEEDMPPLYQFNHATTTDTRLHPLRCLKIFMIKLGFCQERLRIHRPYQFRSYSDETFAHSRNVCISTALEILSIHASPLCEAAWAGLNYKAICASIVLAIDLLQAPNGPESDQHRIAIQGALARIERFSRISTLCRRGAKVLQFLLQRDQEATRKSEPQPKRQRNASGNHTRERTSSESDMRHKIPSPPSSSASSEISPTPIAASTSTSPTTSWDMFQDILGATGSGELHNELGTLDISALLGMDPSARTPPFQYSPNSQLGPSSVSTSFFPPTPTAPAPTPAPSSMVPDAVYPPTSVYPPATQGSVFLTPAHYSESSPQLPSYEHSTNLARFNPSAWRPTITTRVSAPLPSTSSYTSFQYPHIPQQSQQQPQQQSLQPHQSLQTVYDPSTAPYAFGLDLNSSFSFYSDLTSEAFAAELNRRQPLQ
ncbi:hypothetical protein T439DRAFT_323462 [Meredithblackwellia eburnea MCA 4105]